MSTDKYTINCPNCNTSIDVNKLIYSQLNEKYTHEMADEKEKLRIEREEFEKKRQRENEIFQEKLNKKLSEEKEVLEKKMKDDGERYAFSIKQKIEKEYAEQNKLLQTELNEKNEKLVELHKSKAEIEKLKREKKEDEELIKLEAEKKFNEQLENERNKISEQEKQNSQLKIIELEKKLEAQHKLVDEMKRKQEQGSMQMQGEVQELALESLLNQLYPFDEITEVAKGVRGADVLQTVVNAMQQNCGVIIYESKRTKSFSNDWILKLKQDQLQSKADIAVLVTSTMPNNVNQFEQIDGVWVCQFHEIKSLSFVLREMILNIHSTKKTQENRSDKKELLYEYLTSNEFIQKIKIIIQNYDLMKQQLDKEKLAMTKIWEMREKQIWAVQQNVSSLFGSIKGIAGNALQDADFLELGS